jgi:protein TonB
MSEHQALRALEFEISRKLGAIVQVSDYPEEARRNGWTGTTLVGVVVGADARIKAASVMATSGFDVLDQQALHLIKRVKLWWIPHRLRHREVNVSVPVGFFVRGT